MLICFLRILIWRRVRIGWNWWLPVDTIWKSLRTSSTRNSYNNWPKGWTLRRTSIFMQRSATKHENICSGMQNASSIPLKMSTSVLFHAKPCIREFPLSLTTVAGRGSLLVKGVDICARPKRIGLAACGRSFPVRRASSIRADSRLSANLVSISLAKTLLMVFWRSLLRKNRNDLKKS